MTDCDYCGGRLDRPGHRDCGDARHPEPDLAQRIVAIVESELDGRRGLKWSGVDEEILVELRDNLVRQIRAELAPKRTGGA